MPQSKQEPLMCILKNYMNMKRVKFIKHSNDYVYTFTYLFLLNTIVIYVLYVYIYVYIYRKLLKIIAYTSL